MSLWCGITTAIENTKYVLSHLVCVCVCLCVCVLVKLQYNDTIKLYFYFLLSQPPPPPPPSTQKIIKGKFCTLSFTMSHLCDSTRGVIHSLYSLSGMDGPSFIKMKSSLRKRVCGRGGRHLRTHSDLIVRKKSQAKTPNRCWLAFA